jgi:hypothetical protein|tara:strand:- start:2282 stop:2488 length:207 start_codon:yes stop_codon:yes gene_type:complete
MEDIVDLIASGASAADVSDGIKDALYGKAASKIDALRPYAAASLFGDEGVQDAEGETEVEVEPESGDE